MQVREILQEEEDLSEIVQLVGKVDRPPTVSCVRRCRLVVNCCQIKLGELLSICMFNSHIKCNKIVSFKLLLAGYLMGHCVGAVCIVVISCLQVL